MAVEYIVDSDNQATESLLVAYQNERVGTQTTVSGVHSAIRRALAAEQAFATLLEPGGPFETLAAYHVAKLSPLTPYLDSLRAGMVQIADTMETLNGMVPGLFPGVPVPQPEPEVVVDESV